MNNDTSPSQQPLWLTKPCLFSETLPPLRCTPLMLSQLEELMAIGNVPLSRALRAIVGGFLLAGTQEDLVTWAGRELADLDTLMASKRHFEGWNENPNAFVAPEWPLA